jgi:hypothetical protein
MLMSPEQAKAFDERGVGMIYEYIGNAGPSSTNGCPIFFSFQTLTQDEVKILLEERDKLIQFLKGDSSEISNEQRTSDGSTVQQTPGPLPDRIHGGEHDSRGSSGSDQGY